MAACLTRLLREQDVCSVAHSNKTAPWSPKREQTSGGPGGSLNVFPFPEVSFTIAEGRKPLKCPSVEGRINKTLSPHSAEYTHHKWDEALIDVTVWMGQKT